MLTTDLVHTCGVTVSASGCETRWPGADSQYNSAVINTNVIVTNNGEVVWLSHGIFRSSCDINVEYFPFDVQSCNMKWASWTYDGYQLNLKFGIGSGDILRRPPDDPARKALDWNPQGNRGIDRSKITWKRTVLTEAKTMGKTWSEIKELARNRVRRTSFLRALSHLKGLQLGDPFPKDYLRICNTSKDSKSRARYATSLPISTARPNEGLVSPGISE
ncbi:hypothetical protein ANN_02693 [Periplaneta americana]|uniref:Neurotransmitter-gated ion-channel ligand-binding domain-containing protein n=1 Tax=Periplaneta americana TaxID=6978 RepID=A0ABQ8TZX0_PERAM|nr:hypothetical protein ANN_02693 [Periplaneta americana]